MRVSEEIEKTIFFLYSKDEFLAINGKGEIQAEYMQENQGINPYGVIPFVYGSMSQIDLIPIKDDDSFRMSILPSQLYADLNYIVQFQSHSVVYGIDLNVGDLEMNPDSFWLLNSKEGDKTSPSIGTIKPEADIKQVMDLTKQEMSDWFESKGLKVTTSGNVENSVSGIAKIVDEADATEARKKQINIFTKVEQDFWNTLSVMHNYWVETGQIEEQKNKFSEDFDINVEYEMPRPLQDNLTTLQEVKLKMDLGLTSRFRATKQANPTLTDEEVKELIKEIDAEQQAKVDKFMESQIDDSNMQKNDKEPMDDING